MNTEVITKKIRERLDPMVGKVFSYGSHEHLIKKFEILPERERVEIITNEKDFDRPFDSVLSFLDMFKEVRKMAVTNSGGIHEQSEVVIYKTTDYKRFRKINGNRHLNLMKIKRIMKDIDAGIDVLKYYPIQVSEDGKFLDIDDGQHRFYISEKLKRPVYYIIIAHKISLPDIAKINSNTEKWKTGDFINCYIRQDNEHYKILQEFINKYGFTISTCTYLLANGHPGAEGGGNNTQLSTRHIPGKFFRRSNTHCRSDKALREISILERKGICDCSVPCFESR